VTQSESRDVILTRIRNSIQAQPSSGLPTEPIERNYQIEGNRTPEDRIALFAERLREYDAGVTFTDPAGLRDSIARILTASQSQPWIVADGFPADWLAASPSIQWEADVSVDDLNVCAGVLTTCTVGIAITGSIVLQHGPGEGKRRTTLVPDRHLCVIRASQIVETVPEAFARLAFPAARPLTFVSGPSATADIEMTRIRGVHGPRQLDVILVGE
jgi:L-lactate dehydrogenase complex protein LldG